MGKGWINAWQGKGGREPMISGLLKRGEKGETISRVPKTQKKEPDFGSSNGKEGRYTRDMPIRGAYP